MGQKRILIPGGSIDDSFLIQAARKQGLYVITSGTRADVPGHAFADEYVCADYSDKEAMLAVAKEKKIDYMCSCSNDLAMVSTAYVCEQLGLPGHDSYETTLCVHEKDRFKRLVEEIGLSSPVARTFTDETSAQVYLRGLTGKYMIKPIDAWAGRGITEVSDPTQYAAAVKYAFENSREKRVVIEPFIEGQLHSASCYLVKQKVVFCFMEEGFGRPTNPYAVMAAISPARDKSAVETQFVNEVEKVASKLALVDGKIHANFIVDENQKVHIIEMHRRCSGGAYAEFVELATGVAWSEWIVKAEMGLPVDDFPRSVAQQGYYMNYIMIPRTEGTYVATHFHPSIERCIAKSHFAIEPGAEIDDCKIRMIGMLNLCFPSQEEMISALNNRNNLVEVIMEDRK